jgi:carbonic anhydrase/acetyltransferase-like protein (isoleucine patch superfamily)
MVWRFFTRYVALRISFIDTFEEPFTATSTGDGGRVFIGHGSSILDNAIVHGTQAAPVTLGNDVVISAGAIVRSATIGNGAMIGMGAVVLPGATIGSDSFVDAGAVVSAGAVVPPGELWSGRPARHLRTLSLDEIKYLRSMAIELAGLAQQHCDEGEKSVTDVEADYETKLHRQVRRFFFSCLLGALVGCPEDYPEFRFVCVCVCVFTGFSSSHFYCLIYDYGTAGAWISR